MAPSTIKWTRCRRRWTIGVGAAVYLMLALGTTEVCLAHQSGKRNYLLLVDEPTASLDPKTSRQIMRLRPRARGWRFRRKRCGGVDIGVDHLRPSLWSDQLNPDLPLRQSWRSIPGRDVVLTERFYRR
jgi:ABC-type antimicrobial peptide transport system ATPase subunit